jgi:amphiphysin
VLKDKFGDGEGFEESKEDEASRESVASSSTERNSGYQRSSSGSHDNRYSLPAVAPPSYNSSSLAKRASTVSSVGKKMPPPIPPKRRQTVSANYDYQGQRDGDLSFRKGDVIEIIRKGDDDWWRGKVNGQEGDFPSNYCSS